MITVIMPVFNTKPYLEQAVESVLHQTYQDWELVLVDDGSSDGSEDMCDYYTKKDNRIRVIHQDNRGPSGARNTGMKYASGEYIQFLDSDDWLYPDTLKISYETAVSSNSDMVIFDAQYEGDSFSWHEKSTIPDGTYDSLVILEKLAKPSIPPYAWNKFCRTSLYESISFPEGENWEDVATTFYPVSRAKKIAVLGKPLYHYRQSPDAITKVAIKNGSVHKWRFLQYRKRYEFLKNNYPEIADVAKESVFINGLLYYSVCLRGENENKERGKILKFLCSKEFDKSLEGKKLRLARILLRFCPSITVLLVRKRYTYK